MLSTPPLVRAFINDTFASAYIVSKEVPVLTVGVFLTDLGKNPGNESCFNRLLHGVYVDDVRDFIGWAFDPIRNGTWTSTGIVRNSTDESAGPVDCMKVMVQVFSGV